MPATLTIDPVEDIVPFTAVRASLSKYMEQTRRTGRPIIVTQNGRASTILADLSMFDDLIESLEVRRDVERGLEDMRAGRVFTKDEARKRVMARFEK